MAAVEPITTPPQAPSYSRGELSSQEVEGPIWQRFAIYAGSMLLLLTGLPLTVIRLFLTPTDPFSVFIHPLQPTLQMIHVLSIPLFLVGVGALLVSHAAPHLKQRLNTPSGILTLINVGILTYSGLLLFYLGSERWLQLTLSIHILSGIAFPILLVSHILLGFRVTKEQAGREGRQQKRYAHAPSSRQALK